MKRILLFFSLLLCATAMAQDYEPQWQELVALEKQGLIKSAAKKADAIYLLAKKDHNEPEVIRTFFFRSKYIVTLEEDARQKIINAIREDIKAASPDGRAIMQSLYASMLEDMRYGNWDRETVAIGDTTIVMVDSATVTYDETLIDTTTTVTEDLPYNSIETIFGGREAYEKEIEDAYIQSIADREALYAVPLEKYDAVLILSAASRQYKRQLYDFLAERYTGYLTRKCDYSYSLSENTAMLFGDTDEFLKFNTKDTPEPDLAKYIGFCKDLEAFYKNKGDRNSLTRAVTERLNFLRHRLRTYNGDAYFRTLEKISADNTPTAMVAALSLVDYYRQESDDESAGYLEKVVALCDRIIANTVNPDAAASAVQLRINITEVVLRLETKEFFAPGKPQLAKIDYKNTNAATVQYYRLTYKEFSTPNTGHDHYLGYTKSHKPYTEKQYSLPGENDYLMKATEIILPALPAGIYLMAVTTEGKNDTPSFTIIQATEVTALSTNDYRAPVFDIADRTTGKLLKGAVLTYKDRKYTSDKNGRISLMLSEKDNDVNEGISSLIFKKDTIALELRNYRYYTEETDKEPTVTETTRLYLDRAIYRPGQELYFKGIFTQEKDGVHSVVTNIPVFVRIDDSNGNKLQEFSLTTNEFGSVSGTYTLPANVMTGQFNIRAYRNTDEFNFGDGTWFRVEEYKRPTFQVAFDPVKDVIRTNEPATLKGTVTAYTGAAMPYATVKYTIAPALYPRSKKEITGEVKTGADGKFSIPFTAVPYDIAMSRDTHIAYYYNLSVAVTDLGGETRTASQQITAADFSHRLSVFVPMTITKERGGTVTFDSQNLNEVFLPVEGEIKVYRRISSENRLTGNRPWDAPEKHRIPKEEFVKNFPYIPYEEDGDSKRGEMVFSQKVNTETAKKLQLNGMGNWATGDYEVVFSPLGDNKSPEAVAGFYLKSNKAVDKARLFEYDIINENFAKDGYVALELSTPARLHLNIKAGNSEKGTFHDAFIVVDNTHKIHRIPLPKGTNGTASMVIYYIWENENYTHQFNKQVLAPVEGITIETVTMNQKMVPGSPQTWSFTIKGNKGAAEILASMYDASLDQFGTERWQPLWHEYDGGLYFSRYPLTGSNAYSHIGDQEYSRGDNVLFFPDRFLHDAGHDILLITENRQKEKSILARGGYMLTGIVSVTGRTGGNATITSGTDAYTTETDRNGVFRMAVTGTEVLEVNLEDYTSEKIPVNGKRFLNIQLKPNADAAEPRFSGYGPVYNWRRYRRGAQAAAMKMSAPQDHYTMTDTLSVGLNYEMSAGIDEMKTPYESYMKENYYDLTTDADDVADYVGSTGLQVGNVSFPKKRPLAIQPRRNFKETAFFYPHLTAGKDGSVTFTFTSPEALTEWKLRLLAHDKDALSGYLERTAITQKDLMVVPNMPRFLREKDTVVIFAKVVNLTAEPKTGTALLQLLDAVTMQPVDAEMLNANNMKAFTIPANGTSTVSWTIAIPEGLQGVQYKVLAKAGDFTDGEENILPVLPNNMLVTESMPLWVKPGSTKEYTFENLKNNSSPTLRHQGISLEYTSNPAWLALKSLPYLMEYEHQCAEQVFSRYYANAIATHIVEGNPAIAAVFAEWRKAGKPVSKFEQNEELKSVIMAETPWLLDAESDEEQKNRLALLFDLDKMKTGLKASFEQLLQKQSESGAFPWFDGGQDNEYITRHILAGFGHLQKLGIESENESKTGNMLKKAIAFTDAKFMEQYQKTIIAHGKKTSFIKWQPYSDLHYLYMRSFYLASNPLSEPLKEAIKPYLNDIRQDWQDYSLYEKGMAALALHRFGDTATAKKIVESLRQTSANNEEWGMYWIANKAGWDWHRAPIETQALLIEAFTEIDSDTKSADAMKVWLIKQKQAKNWPTTKSTSEAVYALLMQGSNWLSVKENTVLTLGDSKLLEQKIAESGKEAETGYMKLQWKPGEVTKEMATLKIENKSDVPGYGGFYWQYFEDLDKIKSAQKGIMNVEKELYLKTTATDGEKLQRTTAANPLKIGDLVTVRLVVTVKEDVEYIHLKDPRAAAFEPVDVLSGYKWQDGLGYYQSTRDTATHFFFDTIKRGTYVLEYDVRVNNAGEYSNGITSIQSMYAPEFSGHTRGIRVKAVEK